MSELSEVKKLVLSLSDQELMEIFGAANKKRGSSKKVPEQASRRWFDKPICGLTKSGLTHLKELEEQLEDPIASHHVDRKQLRYLRALKKMKMVVPPYFKEMVNPKQLYQHLKTFCLAHDIPDEIVARLVPSIVTYLETGRLRPIIIVGDAGCGKTTAFKLLLEEALGIRTALIRVSQLDGSHGLVGDSPSVKDADAGEFARARHKENSLLMGFLIDEIDKAPHYSNRASVDEELLSITDESVSNIYDHFLEDCIVGLEHCPIIFTANDLQKVNPILVDRCTVIKFPNANAARSKSIARKYASEKMESSLYRSICLDFCLMDKYIEKLVCRNVTSLRKHQQMIECVLENALNIVLEQESEEVVVVTEAMFAEAEQAILGTVKRRTGFMG